MAQRQQKASDVFDINRYNPLSARGPLQSVYNYLANAGRTPQQENEAGLVYGTRKIVGSPFTALQDFEAGVMADAAAAVGQAVDTPARQKERAVAKARGAPAPAASVFPNSYKDPAYDQAEALAQQRTGVPAQFLRTLRINGERSNNDQVSSAGARSPYQIIPETAAGIRRNYKIDPFSSPENAALAAAYVAKEQANLRLGRPIDAPVDWNDPRVQEMAARGYHAGANTGGPQNNAYAQRTLRGGLAAPFTNPFDPTYHNQALGAITAGAQAALKPETIEWDRPAAPELPTPAAMPKTDFSQADQWLADMKPQEMLEVEKKQIEREGWFSGLAKAASSISGSEGIGTMFLRLGAGSLGGRMAAKSEVRERMDQFDKKMTQWQMLNFQNEGQKAQVVAAEARAEAQQLNAHAMDKFKIAYEQWGKDNSVSVQGDAVVTSRVGANGQMQITRTPLQGPILSAFALHRAQTLSALGGLQNNGNSMVASANNGLLANEAAQMFAESRSGGSGVTGQEAQDALVTSQALAATNAVKFGRLADIIPGEEDQKGLFKEVDTAMQSLGMVPGSADYNERREMMIAERLLRIGMTNRELMERIQNAGGAGLVMGAAERFNQRTERQSVDSRGRQTSSVSYRGE